MPVRLSLRRTGFANPTLLAVTPASSCAGLSSSPCCSCHVNDRQKTRTAIPTPMTTVFPVKRYRKRLTAVRGILLTITLVAGRAVGRVCVRACVRGKYFKLNDFWLTELARVPSSWHCLGQVQRSSKVKVQGHRNKVNESWAVDERWLKSRRALESVNNKHSEARKIVANANCLLYTLWVRKKL